MAENAQAPVQLPGNVFRWPVRVYWEDTDAGGIVFYANYLKFFERCRTEWLRSLGIEQRRLQDTTGGVFVVIETSTHHHRPARLDDQLIVTATLLQTGRASLIIGQQALLKSEHLKPVDESAPKVKNVQRHEYAEAPRQPDLALSQECAPRSADDVGDQLLCEGRIRIGWVDAASMRPARIPDSLVSRLRTTT